MHGYLSYLPTSFALCFALALPLAAGALAGRRWNGGSARSLWLFGLVPVLGFVGHSFAEPLFGGSGNTPFELAPIVRGRAPHPDSLRPRGGRARASRPLARRGPRPRPCRAARARGPASVPTRASTGRPGPELPARPGALLARPSTARCLNQAIRTRAVGRSPDETRGGVHWTRAGQTWERMERCRSRSPERARRRGLFGAPPWTIGTRGGEDNPAGSSSQTNTPDRSSRRGVRAGSRVRSGRARALGADRDPAGERPGRPGVAGRGAARVQRAGRRLARLAPRLRRTGPGGRRWSGDPTRRHRGGRRHRLDARPGDLHGRLAGRVGRLRPDLRRVRLPRAGARRRGGERVDRRPHRHVGSRRHPLHHRALLRLRPAPHGRGRLRRPRGRAPDRPLARAAAPLRRPRRTCGGPGRRPPPEHPHAGRNGRRAEPRGRVLVEPLQVGPRDGLRRGDAHPVGARRDARAGCARPPLRGGPGPAPADGADPRARRRALADAVVLRACSHAGRARARLGHLSRDRGRALDGRAGVPRDRPADGGGRPLAAGHARRAALLEHGGRLGRRPAGGGNHLRLSRAPHLERALGQPVRPPGADEDHPRRPAARARGVQQPLRGPATEGGNRVRARAATLPAHRRSRAPDHGRDRRGHRRARELGARANTGHGDWRPATTQ